MRHASIIPGVRTAPLSTGPHRGKKRLGSVGSRVSHIAKKEEYLIHHLSSLGMKKSIVSPNAWVSRCKNLHLMCSQGNSASSSHCVRHHAIRHHLGCKGGVTTLRAYSKGAAIGCAGSVPSLDSLANQLWISGPGRNERHSSYALKHFIPSASFALYLIELTAPMASSQSSQLAPHLARHSKKGWPGKVQDFLDCSNLCSSWG